MLESGANPEEPRSKNSPEKHGGPDARKSIRPFHFVPLAGI
jgi:hypothetical protein